MADGTFYDGTKLLSMKDLNGETPEIFMCTSNRSAGKTTYFGRLLMNRWFKDRKKFCLVYRFNYELDGVADKFFKDIQYLFFPDWRMQSKRMANGIFHSLFVARKDADDKDATAWDNCGYAITLNSADQLKKYSHFFSDVEGMLFDEFQSETNHYCSNEVTKFVSIHTSIARGAGKQVRYVPVYMISNPVSIINPYYVELGISERLQTDTKFLKGDGFVLEQGYNQVVSSLQKESPFNRAFAQNKYTNYASEGVYLNDNLSFVDKPFGNSRYLATIRYEDKDYALRAYDSEGIIYCDTHDDSTFTYRIAVTTDDHRVNYVMLERNDSFIGQMRYFFEHGCFRFRDLKCKEAVMKLISY